MSSSASLASAVGSAASSVIDMTTSSKSRDEMENIRKCKNFLSTLIKLASNLPGETDSIVRNLVQGLIVSEEGFVCWSFH